MPFGSTSTGASIEMLPEIAVPVTTVPKPLRVNTLSTGSLKMPFTGFGSTFKAISFIFSLSSSKLYPVFEDTGIISALSRKVPFTKFLISSVMSVSQSFSTRSDFVKAIKPFFILRRLHMARCSRLCGIIPSSAAITNSTISMPPAPASIFFISFSWPGTSTIPTLRPSG